MSFVNTLFFLKHYIILEIPLTVVIILISSVMISATYMQNVHHFLSYDSNAAHI